jgi:hypothetical protein
VASQHKRSVYRNLRAEAVARKYVGAARTHLVPAMRLAEVEAVAEEDRRGERRMRPGNKNRSGGISADSRAQIHPQSTKTAATVPTPNNGAGFGGLY